MTDDDLAECIRSGEQAGRNGVPFAECPYTFAQAGVDQATFEAAWRPRLDAWFAGWKRTSPPITKRFNPRWHKAAPKSNTRDPSIEGGA